MPNCVGSSKCSVDGQNPQEDVMEGKGGSVSEQLTCSNAELELPAVAYGAPLESPSVKKTSKPTVSEILRSAGIRVKHKQPEPQGLRTAPPRQAPRDYSPPGVVHSSDAESGLWQCIVSWETSTISYKL